MRQVERWRKSKRAEEGKRERKSNIKKAGERGLKRRRVVESKIE